MSRLLKSIAFLLLILGLGYIIYTTVHPLHNTAEVQEILHPWFDFPKK